MEEKKESSNNEEYIDIKSPSSIQSSFSYIRVYKNSHKIFFIGRNDNEVLKIFNEFKVHKMTEHDIFSVVDMINHIAEKYAIYDKLKNKTHKKKIKNIVNNIKESQPNTFFKTNYDVVGCKQKGAWSKHGPTYISKQHYLLDDYSLAESYILNYPMTANLKVIINIVCLNNELKIGIRFKEGDEPILLKNLQHLNDILEEKLFFIYLSCIRKHLNVEINQYSPEDITLLRMIKI